MFAWSTIKWWQFSLVLVEVTPDLIYFCHYVIGTCDWWLTEWLYALVHSTRVRSKSNRSVWARREDRLTGVDGSPRGGHCGGSTVFIHNIWETTVWPFYICKPNIPKNDTGSVVFDIHALLRMNSKNFGHRVGRELVAYMGLRSEFHWKLFWRVVQNVEDKTITTMIIFQIRENHKWLCCVLACGKPSNVWISKFYWTSWLCVIVSQVKWNTMQSWNPFGSLIQHGCKLQNSCPNQQPRTANKSSYINQWSSSKMADMFPELLPLWLSLSWVSATQTIWLWLENVCGHD